MTADDEDEMLGVAAYVLGSRYRKIVMKELSSQPKTPSSIANQHNLSRSHVSRALSELSDRDIVHSHSSGSRTKLYTLTSQGDQVMDLLDEIEEEDNDC